VAAASYEARQVSGVYSAMPSVTGPAQVAQSLCLYRRALMSTGAVSQQIRDIFARYTLLIEPLSLDEGLSRRDSAFRSRGSRYSTWRGLTALQLNLSQAVAVLPDGRRQHTGSGGRKPAPRVFTSIDKFKSYVTHEISGDVADGGPRRPPSELRHQ